MIPLKSVLLLRLKLLLVQNVSTKRRKNEIKKNNVTIERRKWGTQKLVCSDCFPLPHFFWSSDSRRLYNLETRWNAKQKSSFRDFDAVRRNVFNENIQAILNNLLKSMSLFSNTLLIYVCLWFKNLLWNESVFFFQTNFFFAFDLFPLSRLNSYSIEKSPSIVQPRHLWLYCVRKTHNLS